jgi:hypothetical protein
MPHHLASCPKAPKSKTSGRSPRFTFSYLSLRSCLKWAGTPWSLQLRKERCPVAPFFQSLESQAGSPGPRLVETEPCERTKGQGPWRAEDRKHCRGARIRPARSPQGLCGRGP